MRFTGERMIPEYNKQNLIYGEHFSRYHFASQFVRGKKVLDVACGSGYGTLLLKQMGALSVIGVDIDEETIAYAKQGFSGEGIEFFVGDAQNLNLPDNSFDLVVSFETIEHLPDYLKFLEEVDKVLKDDGVFIVSTPNNAVYPKGNPYHVKEFSREEFEDVLSKYFSDVDIKFQDNFLANVIYSDLSEAAKALPVFDADLNKKQLYMVATCSKRGLGDLSKQDFAFVTSPAELSFGDLKGELEERTKWALRLNKENREKDQKIIQLCQKLEATDTLKEESLVLDKERQLLLREKEELERSRDELLRKVGNLEKQLSDMKVGHDNASHRIQSIESSYSYKIGRLFTWPLRIIFPVGSKREVFLKAFSRFWRNPLKFGKKLTWTNIKNFFISLREDDALLTEKKLDDVLARESVADMKNGRSQQNINENFRSSELDIYENMDTSEKLVFKKEEEPLVSIIIPVYNNWAFNYACLYSILKNTQYVSYEVIIADDLSDDETKNIDQYVENIVVVRHEENLRFLKNCNKAAEVAKGKYVLFLNNDTNVQKGWLSSLVELIESDEKIGMVGSKLVYPNGKLQEAGGIIWKNASGWNFGRMDDPEKPEYNYVKEVDYISGAAIMIRRDLWQEIGGFDELFCPCYAEDSDLAFEVRKRGYKLMYQPKSVVVHFEGMSHGTDENSGLKNYQLANREKFLKKWGEVLEKEHFDNGREVFWARDRSRDKKTILFIDHHVPEFDKDAGSRTVFQYIKLMVELGYNVKFLGDNFAATQPYTDILQQLGVEVLYGPWYRDNWSKWVKSNAKYLDFVYTNRPHISDKYVELIKAHSKAKVVYYGHDLHYLRELRRYEIERDHRSLKESERWKKIEFKMFKSADTVFTVSEDEKKIISKNFPDKDIVYMPAFFCEEFEDGYDETIDERKNVLFVGGFRHTPNVNGLKWLIEEVWPLIQKELPDLKLCVAGSHPTEEIKAFASDKIQITGYVSDENLQALYDQSRLVVVPLRYGAGVKGKTIEAMFKGVPVVSTKFGIEGLPNIDEVLKAYDDAASFANRVVELYGNAELARELNKMELKYVKDRFSKKAAEKIVLEVFK